MTGYTDSAQATFPRVIGPDLTQAGAFDAFVAKVNPAGTALDWCGYIGGDMYDEGKGIAVDGNGDSYVVGVTYSRQPSFPTTPGSGATQNGDEDTFVTKVKADGTSFVYSGFVVGSDLDAGRAIALDAAGQAYIAGVSYSADFPVTGGPDGTPNGDSDAFIAVLNAAGTGLVYAGWIGGSGYDEAWGVAVDGTGNAYVVGETDSGEATFPAKTGPDTTFNSGSNDAFVTKIGMAPPPVEIDSFFLPKTVKASVNAARPAKSKLVATGFFDTGSKVVDLTHAATLEIGDIVIAVPGLTPDGKGKKFTYSAGGVTFLIVPNPNGSSRAKFRLIRTGDLTGHVALNGELRLRFTNDVVDGICRVQLGAGSFRLGSKRGALVAPNLFVVRARATLRGAGNDELSLIVGLATGGVTPGAAPEVAVSFGPVLSATITSGQFTNQGDVFTFKGNVGGVTGVVLDYAREQMSVTAKSADLGAFVEGPNPLTIVVGLGSDSRSVAVRAAKKGATLKY